MHTYQAFGMPERVRFWMDMVSASEASGETVSTPGGEIRS